MSYSTAPRRNCHNRLKNAERSPGIISIFSYAVSPKHVAFGQNYGYNNVKVGIFGGPEDGDFEENYFNSVVVGYKFA
jgi:hypothetical protein